jgi:hypothetical protein
MMRKRQIKKDIMRIEKEIQTYHHRRHHAQDKIYQQLEKFKKYQFFFLFLGFAVGFSLARKGVLARIVWSLGKVQFLEWLACYRQLNR